MNDERWRRIEEICHDALEREPRERAAFVFDACQGDEALCQEVEALIANQSVADRFLTDRPSELGIGDVGLDLVGQQIGAYQILSLLGAGGMGEVYRAHDTTLGRDVAIKILPAAFVADGERLARFQREARVLASLNHPHIGAIHGLEQVASTPALILELVDGETLAERLARGPLPLDEALAVARQIADALAAAHEIGVIHRDLKPANIKITPSSTVKVLDFGLAKVAKASDAGLRASGTRDGAILGTAGYMSPEQARGTAVDKRSDIWAFGCVLYEMLTASAAFSGATTSDTIATILQRDPDWGALPAQTPTIVKRMLQRCLAKDPKRRLHDIADASLDMDDARGALSSPIALDDGEPNRRRSRKSRRAVTLAFLGVLTIAVATALAWKLARDKASIGPSVVRFPIDLPSSLVLGNDCCRITRDGRYLVYNGRHEGAGPTLFVRAVDRVESVPIRGVDGPIGSIFLSPDDEWVGYHDTATSTFKKIPLSGGSSRTICRSTSVSSVFRGASWSRADLIVFSTSGAPGLMKVAAAGGVPAAITSPKSGFHSEPHFLPDGRALFFTQEAPDSPSTVGVLALDTGEQRILLAGRSPHFVLPGYLVFLRDGSLWAVEFDERTLEVTGTPTQVLDRVSRSFDVSHSGTIVYSQGGPPRSRLVWVDRQGHEEPLDAPPRAYLYPRLSPDGTRVALDVRDNGRGDIWVWDVARQTLSPHTIGDGHDTYPVWTPDGQRLVFASTREQGGISNLYRRSADGSGQAERLTDSAHDQVPLSFAPDGTLVFRQHEVSHMDLKMLSPSGQITGLVGTGFSEQNAEVSPDGRWVAYESDDSGRMEIYVRPFPNVESGKWMISTGGGTRPLWAPSGRELFYVTGGILPDAGIVPVEVMAVSIRRGTTFSAGKPQKLFEGRYHVGHQGNLGRNYDVSPHGLRFLMVKELTEGVDGPQLVVVVNWVEELRKLVPPGK